MCYETRMKLKLYELVMKLMNQNNRVIAFTNLSANIAGSHVVV